jgi:hypothetical protein
MDEEPPKKSKKRWLFILPAIFISLPLAAFVIYRVAATNLGYTYYEPTYLPPNIAINDKYILNFNGDKTVWLRIKRAIYGIRESNEPTGIPSAVENYDPSSRKPTCHTGKTPAAIPYRVCHWVDFGKYNVNEVKFGKGDTWIVSWLPTNLDQSVTLDQIEKYIDSFEPRSTRSLRVEYTSGG